MGYRGYPESRTVDEGRIQCCLETDRSGAEWTASAPRAGPAAYAFSSATAGCFADSDDNVAGPLPRFEGVNVVYPGPPTAASLPPPPPPPPVLAPQQTAVIRVPPITPQDVDRFSSLFENAGAVDGLLQGV